MAHSPPSIPSSSLPLPPQSWTPLSTAGHSTVFTIPTTPPKVLKLFRFNIPERSTNDDVHPNKFYHNELHAYERLSAACPETGELIIPRFHGSVELTLEHENWLAEKGSIPKLHISRARRMCRKKAGEMPVMGILMDLVPGRRLEKRDLGKEVVVMGEKRKVGLVAGQGLSEMQMRGVRHRDVKWRNVLIVEDEEKGEERRRVVWIDFSNSVVRGEEEAVDGEWERLCSEEMQELGRMLR